MVKVTADAVATFAQKITLWGNEPLTEAHKEFQSNWAVVFSPHMCPVPVLVVLVPKMAKCTYPFFQGNYAPVYGNGGPVTTPGWVNFTITLTKGVYIPGNFGGQFFPGPGSSSFLTTLPRASELTGGRFTGAKLRIIQPAATGTNNPLGKITAGIVDAVAFTTDDRNADPLSEATVLGFGVNVVSAPSQIGVEISMDFDCSPAFIPPEQEVRNSYSPFGDQKYICTSSIVSNSQASRKVYELPDELGPSGKVQAWNSKLITATLEQPRVNAGPFSTGVWVSYCANIAFTESRGAFTGGCPFNSGTNFPFAQIVVEEPNIFASSVPGGIKFDLEIAGSQATQFYQPIALTATDVFMTLDDTEGRPGTARLWCARALTATDIATNVSSRSSCVSHEYVIPGNIDPISGEPMDDFNLRDMATATVYHTVQCQTKFTSDDVKGTNSRWIGTLFSVFGSAEQDPPTSWGYSAEAINQQIRRVTMTTAGQKLVQKSIVLCGSSIIPLSDVVSTTVTSQTLYSSLNVSFETTYTGVRNPAFATEGRVFQ